MVLVLSWLLQKKMTLLKHDVEITPAHLKDKFIFPNMQRYKDKESPFQYFSPLALRARMELEKFRDGVSPCELDELVYILSNSQKVLYFCYPCQNLILALTIRIVSWFQTSHCGRGSPLPDDIYEYFDVLDSPLLISHKNHLCQNSTLLFHYLFCVLMPSFMALE